MRYTTWLKKYEIAEKVWPEYVNFVAVLWVDASHAADSTDSGTIKSFTGGTVVGATKEYLKIAMEIFEDRSDRDVTTIPTTLILKVIPCFTIPMFSP